MNPAISPPTSTLTPSLTLCADDFGMSDGVDDAILRLVERGLLTAVSCMSLGPCWARDARALADLAQGRCDLGLHLDLTEFAADTVRHPLGRLIARAYLGRLDRAALAASIEQQLDAFEAAAGLPPAFVDGHQHVHQLPGVRELLLQALARRGGSAPGPWIRNTRPALGGRWNDSDDRKHRVIAALGSRALQRACARQGLRQNADMLGVYPFDGSAADYEARLQRWLDRVGPATLLMCHPASRPAPGDAIAAARLREYGVLSDPGLLRRLEARGLGPRPLSALR